MLLSICILFCDKDYQYINRLLKNIKDSCCVEYEVILIDNRVDKSERLNFKKAKVYPCDKLGQFNGRRLAISKAKGDYIWFVDADDNVHKMPTFIRDELNLNYDIVTFNAIDSFGDWTGTWPERKEKERLYNRKNLLTHDVETYVGQCVWNKFFKRDILLPAVDLPDTYITFNEDSLFNMIALKYAKTVKSLNCVLYKYNSEVSQAACRSLDDISKFDNLLSSGKNLFKIRNSIFTEKDKVETDKWISEKHCVQFFISRIYHSIPEIQVEEMQSLIKVYDKGLVLDTIQTWGICEANKVKATKEEIEEVLISIYNKATAGTDASLSICFNFCDKDQKYVPNLIKNIKSKVKLSNYEIIICDNRTAENGKDDYIEGVKIWPTGGNLGPLGGRKEALKHVTKDYVWYLDADDLINCEIGQDCQNILNKKYDYIAFKAIDDEGRVSGIWADTSKYNNQEISDSDFFSYRTYLMSGATLWNKWVKTSIFKCILNIPDTTAVCYEDALCNSYIMKHSKNMFLYNKMLYYYRCNLGDANRSNIKELASFQRTTNGGRTSLDLAKKLFTKKELFAMDAWFSDLRYIEFSLKRVVDSDESIQVDEIKDLLKYFSPQDIFTAFKHFTWYFDKWATERAFKKFMKVSRFKDRKVYKHPTLSIIVSFFDKDLKKIHNLLWNIKEKLKTDDYEIILINNCQYNNRFVPMLNGIEVIPTGSSPNENKGTYHARQIGVSKAVGKYVWFIDADDKIISDVTEEDFENLDNVNDIVVFNSIRDDGTETRMGAKILLNEVYKKSTLLTNEFYAKAGPCLWNKWIKREKLLGITDTPEFAINAFEDTIISSFAEKQSTQAKFLTKTIYEYNCSESNTCSSSIRQEDLNKIFLGKDNIEPLKNCLFTQAELSSVFALSPAYSNNFFMSRLQKKAKEDVKYCIITLNTFKTDVPVFSLNEDIENLNNFDYVFTSLTPQSISSAPHILEFKNCCFQNCGTASLKNLFKYNFLLSVSDFKQIVRGKHVEVSVESKNIL